MTHYKTTSLVSSQRNLRVLFIAIITFSATYSTGCRNTGNHKANNSLISSFGIPQVPDSLLRSIAQYQSWNSTAFQDWLPGDAGMVVLTRSGETSQIHIVKHPKAVPQRLTFFSDPVTFVSMCPDPTLHTLLFTRDSGGNENFQIFAMDLDTPRVVLLTDGRSSKNDGIVWSNAGNRFAFGTNKRNGKDLDIYINDIRRPGTTIPVLARGGSWAALDWSPDDCRLIVSRYMSRTAEFIFILNITTGACEPLHDTLHKVSQESAVWGPGGKGIFLT
jgi:Tol biopolymer transport system component